MDLARYLILDFIAINTSYENSLIYNNYPALSVCTYFKKVVHSLVLLKYL